MMLKIATGASRTSKYWKNTDISWEELCDRLGKPTRTSESQGEYKNMSKSKQDSIKDVGGFVGGTLKQGRRKADSVDKRYLITLDADFASQDFCDTVSLFFGFTWCAYSTHKHTPENPRLRLLIPLSRPVDADEYEAVARKVASDIGIDQFDDTTYQASRLMYWPSVSQDGEYLFRHEENKPLDVDYTLSRYRDWRDITAWPVSSRTVKALERTLKKQEDPTGKKGIIGAFCRTYTIEDVITEYLTEVYQACEVSGRYTYREGSTAGGLVIYEDGKFAYSNHATDPAGQTLCNAFDLCRIHLFGDRDEEAAEGTPTIKLPSYLAMQEFARADGKVKRTLSRERMQEAAGDFEGLEILDEADDAWKEELDYDKSGACTKSRKNAVTILENDPAVRGKIAYNEFTGRFRARGKLPWNKETEDRDWTDTDDAGIRYYLERVYGIEGEKKIMDAHRLVAQNNQYHPIREYLDKLSWDGMRRLETVFIDYLGVSDNAYTRAATRKSLTAAVARVINPGVKFDSMLVLVGKQGCGKSQIIKRLGGEWFSDTLTTVQGKEAYEQLQGYWLIEIAELAAMRRAEVEAIKHFVAKSEDAYRAAYGRTVNNYPRQCIFIGTTNKYEFLRDITGNRRFWPLDVRPEQAKKNIWKDLTVEETGQIWAEAVHMYRQDEPLYFDKEEEKALAEAEQEMHLEESPMTGDIQTYLEMLLPENWAEMDLSARRLYLHDEFKKQGGGIKREKVCPIEVWCEWYNGDKRDFTLQKSKEIRDVISKIDGWEAVKAIRFGELYGTQRGFKRNLSKSI